MCRSFFAVREEREEEAERGFQNLKNLKKKKELTNDMLSSTSHLIKGSPTLSVCQEASEQNTHQRRTGERPETVRLLVPFSAFEQRQQQQ